jgi:hypothetical protein
MIATLPGSGEAMPDHVVSGDDPSILNEIARPSISLAIWRRRAPERLREIVRKRGYGGFTALRETIDAGGIADGFADRLAQAGLAPAANDVLAPDIRALVHHFSIATGKAMLDIRLERISGDACKKFHADYVSARLLTTYVGRGTEWLDQKTAARLSENCDPEGIPIRSLAAGDVAILKGRCWAGDAALVHRSPPIAGTGEERLLLVISPAGPSLAN